MSSEDEALRNLRLAQTHFENAISKKDKHIALQTQQISDLCLAVAAKDAELAKYKNYDETLKAQSSHLEDCANKITFALDAKNREIEGYKKQVERYASKLDEYKKQLEEYKKQLEEYKKDISMGFNQYTKLKNERDALRAEIANAPLIEITAEHFPPGKIRPGVAKAIAALVFKESENNVVKELFKRQPLSGEKVEELANRHLDRLHNCCDVPAKFCATDIWRGNLLSFANAIQREFGIEYPTQQPVKEDE